MSQRRHNRQVGFGILELMIGLVLGLMLTGIVLSVFISTQRNYTQDDQIGRMQEDARYALRVLAHDLSMVDFWGNMLNKADINAIVRDCPLSPSEPHCLGFYASSVLPLDADCPSSPPVGTNWAYNLATAISVVTEATATQATTAFTCLDTTEFVAGTDVLAIKRLQGEGLISTRADDSDNGTVFLRTNGEAGMFVKYDSSVTAGTSASVTDWKYLARIYYIRKHSALGVEDNIPTLYRRQLDGTGVQIDSEGVASGIEYFHVMFGLDTDGDGVPNAYVAQPGAAQMPQAVTARIYVLARSHEPDFSYVNDKTYTLGNVTKSASNDNYFRRVFMTTVKLRNPINRNLLGI